MSFAIWSILVPSHTSLRKVVQMLSWWSVCKVPVKLQHVPSWHITTRERVGRLLLCAPILSVLVLLINWSKMLPRQRSHTTEGNSCIDLYQLIFLGVARYWHLSASLTVTPKLILLLLQWRVLTNSKLKSSISLLLIPLVVTSKNLNCLRKWSRSLLELYVFIHHFY